MSANIQKQAVDTASVLLTRIAKASERTSRRLAVLELIVLAWAVIQVIGFVLTALGPSR
jgi:hypothetical protein